MFEWFDSHGLLTLVLFFVYSNLVGSMPSPEDVRKAKPSIGELNLLAYAAVKKFLDLTAANAARVFPKLRAMSNGSK